MAGLGVVPSISCLSLQIYFPFCSAHRRVNFITLISLGPSVPRWKMEREKSQGSYSPSSLLDCPQFASDLILLQTTQLLGGGPSCIANPDEALARLWRPLPPFSSSGLETGEALRHCCLWGPHHSCWLFCKPQSITVAFFMCSFKKLLSLLG